MCGIVGYIGQKNIVEVLISSLKKLEYRGYDSSGIAIIDENNKIIRHKTAGKIENLEKTLPKYFFELERKRKKLNLGIAHTRWATHGKPSEENAHPHIDCKNEFIIVHNGIIENYIKLKNKLQKHKFLSETDTETIIHLLEENYNGDIINTISNTIKQLEGSFAFLFLSTKHPDRIFFARKDSPLVIGIGQKENFIASDIPALLKYTKKFIYLENGDYGEISQDKVKVYNIKNNRPVERKINELNWDLITIEKTGFKHFMLKEIFEQPHVARDNIISRVFDNKIDFGDELSLEKDLLLKINKINIVACGTSYHAGLVGKYFFENILRIPVSVDIGSEFRYMNPIIDKNSLFIFISQSGETADTLASLRIVKEHNIHTLGICNSLGSSLSRETDSTILTRCGPEIGVASTKAFIGQLTCLYLLGLHLSKIRKTLDKTNYENILNALYKIPTQIEHILNDSKTIEQLAQIYHKKSDFLFLGRGINYPIALEGALKLKEISYIHAEGYPAGEMKHGPIALIDEDMPTVIIATKGSLIQKIFSNLQEAKSRDAKIIALLNEDITTQNIDHKILLPETHEILSPLLNVVPLQLLAYYIAVILGRDVDQPRNLAKSVTVE